jgi:hypothetical protein
MVGGFRKYGTAHFISIEPKMSDTEPADALTQMIKILTPLKPEDRRRTVAAAMLFLGEPAEPISVGGTPAGREKMTAAGADDGSYPAGASRWMEQYDVSPEELDRVFHFKGDGTFEIHDVPGKSKKEQTLNTYILTGVGKALVSNDRTFDDAMARGFCERIGCYDKANHATHLKNYKGGEFSGDKSRGYSLTNIGLKRGAALVKEMAGTAE